MRRSDKPRPLLKLVNGEPYAQDGDHEETAAPEPQSESFINADPISSDEEPPRPLVQPSQSRPTTNNRRGNQRKPIKAPMRGTYKQNEATKELRSSQRQGKALAPSSSKVAGNGSSREAADDSMFGMGQSESGPRKKRKITKNTTANVHHAPLPIKPTTYGKVDPMKSFQSRVDPNAPTNVYLDFEDSDDSKNAPKPQTSVGTKAKPLHSGKNKQNSTAASNSGLATPDDTEVGSQRKGLDSSQKSSQAVVCTGSESAKEDTQAGGVMARFKRNKQNKTSDLLPPRFSRSELTPMSDSDDDSPLSSPPPSIKREHAEPTPPAPQITRCPLCKGEVAEEHLDRFTLTHPTMNFKAQQAFCDEHRKRDAEKEYVKRGYPAIAWDALGSRIRKYWPRLETVLTGHANSHFREFHQDQVSKGVAERTALKSWAQDANGLASSGYYGSRGARAMMEAITDNFAPQIRELAPRDKVVSFGGISNFVQAVLVPDLAMLLVMEDMAVGEDEAITIIKESVWIGELVNEEEDDAEGAMRKRNTVSAFGGQCKMEDDDSD